MGFARSLFLDMAGDEKNAVCFVERAKQDTLAGQVQRYRAGPSEPLTLQLNKVQRVPLEGAELEQYHREHGQVRGCRGWGIGDGGWGMRYHLQK